MGNFEKMVVLAVLILSAVILAVSLDGKKGEVEAMGPLDAARARLEEEGPARPAAEGGEDAATPRLEREEAGAASRPGYLLNSTVEPDAPPVASDAAEATPFPDASAIGARTGSDRILRTTRGLEPSVMPDYMLYEVAANDTWNALALRFFGDGRYAENLRTANEGMDELRPGVKIFVPIRDLSEEAGTRAPLAPRDRVAGTEAPGPAKGAAPARTKAPIQPGETYEVQPGDNLSIISKRVYGTTTRWSLIYDANRDLLQSPDWLQVGMRLKIPEPDAKPSAAAKDPNRPRVR